MMPDILIVDDDPLVADALSLFVELEGISHSTASNGLEALEMIRTHRPALVFLDLHMPVMDGASVVRQLRAWGESVPVILMSADPEIKDHARELGVQGYMAKPFSNEELSRILDLCFAA